MAPKFSRQSLRFQPPRCRPQAGQSLLETALLLPLLLLLVLNVINFAYYFMVALNLASAPRQGVEYSILGFQTPGALSLPPSGPTTSTGSVSYLTYHDMGALSGSSSATVRVCTSMEGLVNAGTSTQRVQCVAYPTDPGTFSNPASDPESPYLILHRVDVQYLVTPLIKAQPFGLTVVPTFTFHRQVSMRAIN